MFVAGEFNGKIPQNSKKEIKDQDKNLLCNVWWLKCEVSATKQPIGGLTGVVAKDANKCIWKRNERGGEGKNLLYSV